MANRVAVVINGKEYVSKAADKAGNSLGSLGRTTAKVSKSMARSMAGAAAAVGGLVLLFKGLKTGITQAANFEQIDVSFEVLIGNAEKAKKVVGELRDFSASTPLEFQTITKGAQNLMAFGIGADSVKDKMEMLGNASMGQADKLDSLVRAYGKIRAKGKASLEELNMITEAGVPILQALADQYGISTAELFKMVSSGKVGFADVDKALTSLTTGSGQFAGMLEKQSQTLTGVTSTFKDNLNLTLAELMNNLLPGIKKVLSTIIGMLSKLRDSEAFQAFAQNLGAVLSGLITIIGSLPEYVATIVEAIKSFIDQVFTPEYWKQLGTSMWEWFKLTGEAYLQYIATLVNLLGAVIWEPLKFGFSKAVDGMKSVFVTVVNFFIEKINGVGEKLWDISQNLGEGFRSIYSSVINFIIDKINFLDEQVWNITQKLRHPIKASNREAYSGGIAHVGTDGSGNQLAYPGTIAALEPPVSSDAAFSDVTDSIKEAFAQAKDSLVNYAHTAVESAQTADLRSSIFGPLADAYAKISGDVKDLMEASYTQAKATDANTAATEDSTAAANTGGSAASSSGGVLSVLLGMIPEIGGALKAFGGSMMGTIKSLGSVSAILDPISIILAGVMDVIGPIIDEILSPLVGFLRIIGQTLGRVLAPLLQAVGGILEAVSRGLLWFYNKAILPVANGMITVFNWIYNGVAKIVNGMISGINSFLGWLGVNIKYKMAERGLATGKLDEINYATMRAAGSSYSGTASGSTGSSTSVEQVTIEVHQYFQGPVIGSGGMEQVGEYVVKSIKAYAGVGGNVDIITGAA